MSIATTEKPSILVVDDDKMQRLFAQRLLEREGYEVRTAVDGAQAVQSILADAPDIILTDWNMPNMNGLELCRTVRNNEAIPFIFVIIVSAHNTTTDRLVEAFDAGADDYLAKPLDARELQARLRSGDRIVKLQRELTQHSLHAHRVNAEMEVANSALTQANDRLDLLATTDELTGLYNCREAKLRLAEAVSASNRFDEPLSCIMIDIDHFKSFNDAYGHLIGDLVLKETARVLQQTVREHEHTYRIGGEEFLIICPNTSEDDAVIAAERLRRTVGENTVEHDSLSLRVTISLGVAGAAPRASDPAAIRRAADTALYAAKRGGRNRVCRDQTGGTVATNEPPATGSMPNEPGGGPSLSVLLVAEDSTSVSTARRTLKAHGHRVDHLARGGALPEYVSKHNPDVVVIDATLKKPTSEECTRGLRENPETHRVPIIVLSSRRDGSDTLSGIAAGADDYLATPLNSHELALRVQNAARLRAELDAANSVRGEQTRVLGVISELSRSLAAAAGLDETIKHILSATSELLCSDNVVALRPTSDGNALRVSGQLASGNAPAEAGDIPIASSAIGKVFIGRDPFLVATATDPATDLVSAERSFLSHSPSLVVALRGVGRAVGVLVVAGRGTDRTISSLDLVYMDLICNMGGGAIDDALSRKATDDARDSIVVALATLAEYRDSNTGRHLDRVTKYSLLLAEQLRRKSPYQARITDTLIDDLGRAVPLHDIGKVAIPDSILLKPGKLSAEEFNVMKTHTTIGAQTIGHLVERSPGVSFLETAQQIAQSHHEWFDGSGYPERTSREKIPLSARITTVADVYDAITTRRPYKEPMPHDQAAAIIYNSSGTQFDPLIVEAFSACEEKFQALSLELADDDCEDAHVPVAAPSPVPCTL